MPDALSFDANDVAPRATFDVIPAGWYRAWITDSEMKQNAKGTGEYLQLVWDIIEGEQKGRKVWDRLNVKNANETAQDIARASLSSIMHAIGVMRIQHTGQLHGKPCMIKIVVKPGQVQKDAQGKVITDVEGNALTYEPSNEVKAYKAADGAVAPKVGAGAPGAVRGAARTMESPVADDDDNDGLPF